MGLPLSPHSTRTTHPGWWGGQICPGGGGGAFLSAFLLLCGLVEGLRLLFSVLIAGPVSAVAAAATTPHCAYPPRFAYAAFVLITFNLEQCLNNLSLHDSLVST